MTLKKYNFKLRLQWGWYQATLFGIAFALLIAPAFDGDLGLRREGGDSVISIMKNVSFGGKVKVILNGTVIALANTEEDAKNAYMDARLMYNKKGLRILDVAADYEVVNPDRDYEEIKDLPTLKGKKLSDKMLEAFEDFDGNKTLAYTMRIDDYTVTTKKVEDMITVLERTQEKYDEKNRYKVELTQPDVKNVKQYEVDISSKDVSKEEASKDGVKYVGFSEKIQVMETYVSKEKTKDLETVYQELVAENQEESIYVVEPGDCLSVIAEKNKLTIEQIKELNPHIESDDDIYYDDRLNITVPKAPVQVLVEKQETYKEDYFAEVVYQDDAEMYIGETEVVQEGTKGTHIVTDLVTYKNDIESDREQLNEVVEVAAIAQVVKRGTKSQPTYMYPVTNWNLTSYFGYRWGRLHAGVDVGIPIGTTVRASRGGRVVTAGWLGGYGNCVIIDHGDGVSTRYAHLNEVTVGVGQYVNQGQQVALSGNTGRSTGPHLHFEIRINGQPVDPLPYLN